MRKILFLFCVFFFLETQAQLPYYKWGYSFQPGASAFTLGNCVRTGSGNSVFVGGSYQLSVDFDPSPYTVVKPNNSYPLFLGKYDQDENLVWVQSITTTGGSANLASIYLEGNSFVYMVGDFTGTMDADPGVGTYSLTSNGNSDVFVVKLSQATGQFVSAISFGGANYEYGKDVATDANSNMYITGTFRGTMDANPGAGINNIVSQGGSDDVFLVKLNSAESYVWAFGFGNIYTEEASRVIVKGNSLYLFGNFSDTTDFDPGVGSYTLTPDGTYYLGGFMAKYDLNSNLIGAKQISGMYGDLHIYDAKISKAGQVYICGKHMGLSDFDPAGALDTSGNPGADNAFVAKYDTSFSHIWAKSTNDTYGTYPEATFNSLEVDSLNSIYLVGSFNRTIDADGGPGTYTLMANADQDIVVSRYNGNGAFLSAFNVGMYLGFTTAFNEGRGIAVDHNLQFYITGRFYGGPDFDPQSTTNILAPGAGNGTAYLVKYGPCASDTNTIINATKCYKQTYSLGGTNYAETGTYKHTFYKANGCDSIVTLHLNVNHVNTQVTTAGNVLTCHAPAPSTFAWLNCSTNTLVAGATSSSHIQSTNNSYAAIVTSNGCTDTSACINAFAFANAGAPMLAWADTTRFWEGKDKFMVTDQYGNLYVTGSYSSILSVGLQGPGKYVPCDSGSSDVFVCKYDNNGIHQLTFHFGDNGTGTQGFHYTEANCLQVDPSGNIYVAGFFEGTVDFDPGPGTYTRTATGYWDVFFAKYNANGQVIWAKSFGGGGSSLTQPMSMTLDKNGNLYVSGNFQANTDMDPGAGTYILNSLGSRTGFVGKYDNSGNFLMAMAVGGCNVTYDAGVTSVSTDSDNNLLITGTFMGTFDFDPGAGTANLTSATPNEDDIYFAKYSPTMQYKWAKRFGGASDDHPDCIIPDANNNIYLLGKCFGAVDLSGGAGTGMYTINEDFIAKYDSAGTFQLKYPLVATNSSSGIQSLVLDAAANVYVAGHYFGSVDFGTGSQTSVGNNDGFVAKYLNNGSLDWGFRLASAGNDHAYSLAVDPFQNIFVGGDFSNTVDFDPTSTTYTMSAGSTFVPYLAKYGQNCGPIPTGVSASGSAVIANAAGAYYIWKNCSNGQIVGTSLSASYVPPATGSYKAIIYEGNCIDSTSCISVTVTVGVHLPNKVTFDLYPNPSNGKVNIVCETPIDEIRVRDVLGNIVFEQSHIPPSTDLMLETPGIYFVTLTSGGKSGTQKLVVNRN